MEKVDIFEFRMYIEDGVKDEIVNVELIEMLLISRGIVKKPFGLCAEPFDKYYTISNTDERGVSCVKSPLNTIHVRVNYETSTRKKRIYFYSIEITYIEGVYYFCCLAQYSYYKKSIGAEYVVYKTSNELEISIILDEIFNDVEQK